MWRAGPVVAALVLMSACGISPFPSPIDSNGVTAAELRTHPEATLTYPISHDVTLTQQDELDRGTFENLAPTPALATVQFTTGERPDTVIAWYEARLGPRGWLDATMQGDGNRRWTRGRAEDFYVDCSYVAFSGERTCQTAYTLRSARFKPQFAAAPPFGDPVSQAAVEHRVVGLAALEFRVQYESGPPIPMDGTPEAAAARTKWAAGWCCASPVMLQDTAQPEGPAGLRSAYHALVLEVAEYDRPDLKGGSYGSMERDEMRNLTDSGFLVENVGQGTLNGHPADAFVYERGLREAVIFTINYGDFLSGGQGVRYRVATIRIIYDVAPSSCDLSRPECFGVLAGTTDAVWSHA